MKETLDEQSRLGLIHYRIERADETLEEVGIYFKGSNRH